MTSMVADLNGRLPQLKMNSKEDDLDGRLPQWKATSMEDDFKEKLFLKKALQEVDFSLPSQLIVY